MSEINDVCSKMLSYVHAHYNEPLTLKQVAAALYMNPAYLGRLFKKQTGYQFSDYLAAYRISVAEKILSSRNASVADVAHAVGYGNVNQFFKRFKQLTGNTPSRFRTNLQLYAPSANLFITPDEMLDGVIKCETFTLECPVSSANCCGAFMSQRNSLFYVYIHQCGSDFQIRCVQSVDGGLTWNAPRTLFERRGEEIALDGVSSISMADDSLGLFLSERRSDGVYLTQYRSHDELSVWKPFKKPFYLTGEPSAECGQIVRLGGGRLVLPVSSCRAIGSSSRIVSHYVSDDDGASWRMTAHIVALPYRTAVNGLRYPLLLPDAGGALHGYAATDLGCQYEYVSSDNGETWTSPQPTPFTSPSARMAMTTLASGRRVVVFDPIPDYATLEEESRSARLVCLAGKSNGKGWAYPIFLENVRPAGGVRFSCPVLFPVNDTLLVAYMRRDGSATRLHIRRIPRSMLIPPLMKSSNP